MYTMKNLFDLPENINKMPKIFTYYHIGISVIVSCIILYAIIF
jgi:hypothetical protein